MGFFDVNWLGIVLATIAAMALGMVWYKALNTQFMAALGKTGTEIKTGGPVSPVVFAAITQVIMAYFIAWLTPLVMGELDWINGMKTAALLWVGFVLTSMVLNHRFQGQKWSLTVIDGGYLLCAMVLQGVVLGVAGN